MKHIHLVLCIESGRGEELATVRNVSHGGGNGNSDTQSPGQCATEMPGPQGHSLHSSLQESQEAAGVLLLEWFGGTVWSVLAALLTLVSAHFLSVMFQPCHYLCEKPTSVAGAEEPRLVKNDKVFDGRALTW